MAAACATCGKEFRDAHMLRRHKSRKTPCQPILDPGAPPPGPPEGAARCHCHYCGRAFASASSKCRHIKKYCRIANSEEGMARLFDHTAQRQLADQQRQIDQLRSMVEQHRREAFDAMARQAGGTVINIQQNIILNAWDGERRISVGIDQILAAFSQNPRLREYSRLGDHGMADPAVAPPYVADLLMDLVRRAHAAPEARNVYLNPKRADQALVHMSGGRWEVVTLGEATRLLFDGVVVSIHQVSKALDDLKRLPLEAQSALGMAGMMYGDEPEEYVRRARGPMAAHLTNCGAAGPAPPPGADRTGAD